MTHALPSAHYEPLRHPRAPSLSLAGLQLVIADHALGLPVLHTLSLCTCCRHYPGAAAGRIASLSSPSRVSLPRYGSRHSQDGPEAGCSECPGGQGVRSDPESEGSEEKYRAVINGGHPEDEQVGQRWGKVEPALWGRRRYSFTHRTKVFADGTIRKIHA